MAYYSSNFYESDVGEYHWTPYSSSYDIVPFQDSISYSVYKFSEPKFIEYDQSSYGGAHDPFLAQSEIHYSTYNINEPKLIEYNPTPYGTGYFSSQTQYMVSYSTTEINDLDFVEYDPTPYGGGYDIAQTYGKPLLPSNEICYPRSMPESDGLFLDPSPHGKDDNSTKPLNGGKPIKAIEEEKQSYGGTPDLKDNNGHGGQIGKPSDSNQGEEREVYVSDDNYPWSDYDYGVGNGRSEEYCYGHDKQVPQAPYGYGSDAMDFCERIFGYWPCLSRKDQKSHGLQEVADEESKENQWNGAADYLFGSTNSYGNYGDLSHSYERHYQEQPHYRQVGYGENSCLQHFQIFEDCN